MKLQLTAALLTGLVPSPTFAHEIKSPVDSANPAAFDIVTASAMTDGHLTTFVMEVAEGVGTVIPKPIGKLAGAGVDAYVWPTKINPSRVGFDEGSGLLALAVTAHPDFDDTPLFDENSDGDPTNDGRSWHTHWVILNEDPTCGAGLKVRDITPGNDLLPPTAPGLPIALDSPGMSPILNGDRLQITVPLKDAELSAFDAVTAKLQVNENAEVPLLCVTSVQDIASGDLSFPGVIMQQSR
mgnify:CR=1 FL=1